jgi:hypothetical protein
MSQASKKSTRAILNIFLLLLCFLSLTKQMRLASSLPKSAQAAHSNKKKKAIRHGHAVLPLRSVLRTERLGSESSARNARVGCPSGTEAAAAENDIQDISYSYKSRLSPDAHGHHALAATFAQDRSTRRHYREARKMNKAALVDSDMEMRALLAPTFACG